MPWKVIKKEDKYCVVKETDGSEVACHDSEMMAEKHKEALYANVEEKYEDLQRLMLEDGSPVILGVAATNRPHLPLPPMSVVEKDGETYIRVPFLRKGIFRHPTGNLVFNEQVMKEMLSNHNNKKSHYGVSLDLRHKPELGALAWFDKERGGFVELERDTEYGDLLVGYGKPTSEEASKMIKNKQYVFASVEFHPKWKGNMVQKLSIDEVEEIALEDLVENVKFSNTEEIMDKIEITREEYDRLLALESQVESMKRESQEEQIPENIRIRLEDQTREIQRLKRKTLESQVESIIAKAETYRDNSGRAHSPVLLELAKAAMLGLEVQNGDEVIKLESSELADVVDYNRRLWIKLLETNPGSIQFESRTEVIEEENPYRFENGNGYSKEQYADFWVDRV